MKHVRACALAFGVSLLATLAVGCGDDDAGSASGTGGTGGATDEEGLSMCCQLGALCHRVGETAGPREECHELGHINDPAQCRANYDRCMEICAAGGAGGSGSPHSCL